MKALFKSVDEKQKTGGELSKKFGGLSKTKDIAHCTNIVGMLNRENLINESRKCSNCNIAQNKGLMSSKNKNYCRKCEKDYLNIKVRNIEQE